MKNRANTYSLPAEHKYTAGVEFLNDPRKFCLPIVLQQKEANLF